MDGNGKISVIITAYNTEPFLPQCLESVTGQTYRSLEIILVDDGSADRTGAIFDEYAARDGRIRVVHQPNRGLSEALNVGLDLASGQYLAFADSDDFLDRNMFSLLAGRMEETGADMAVCGYRYAGVDGKRLRIGTEVRGERGAVSAREAFRLFLTSYAVEGFSWNKLYRRGLFENGRIRFPEHRKYEDIPTIARLLAGADSVCFVDRRLYHYRLRPGSIVATSSLSNSLDFIRSLREVGPLAEQLGLGREYRYYYNTRIVAFCFRLLRGGLRKDQAVENPLLRETFREICKMKFRKDFLGNPLWWKLTSERIKIPAMYFLVRKQLRNEFHLE